MATAAMVAPQEVTEGWNSGGSPSARRMIRSLGQAQATEPTQCSIIFLIRVVSPFIANGFVISSIPGSRNPFAVAAFSV